MQSDYMEITKVKNGYILRVIKAKAGAHAGMAAAMGVPGHHSVEEYVYPSLEQLLGGLTMMLGN